MRTAILFVLLLINCFAKIPEQNSSPGKVQVEPNLLSDAYDVVVFINDATTGLGTNLQTIENALSVFTVLNPSVGNTLDVIPYPEHPCRKLIFSSTGDLSSDVSSSRDIRTATEAAFRMTTSLGLKKVLLVIGPMNTAHFLSTWSKGKYAQLNAAMSAMHTLFYPYVVRIQLQNPLPKCDILGLYNYDEKMLPIITAIGQGMAVLRDIGNTEPEVMVPKEIVAYLDRRKPFWSTAGISYEVEEPTLEKYPMCQHVNRASSINPLHQGKIVTAVYNAQGTVTQTLLLVGKGITFDSGGADVKINGGMTGMHNDKLGAATVAGFFEILAHLKPQGLKVWGYMPFIRNDIGKLAYLPDEIVVLTNGLRVRIGNTDAEGRNVMADVLIHAKNQALKEINPHIFTIATLTGAASRSFGPYSLSMDNGPARAVHMAEELMETGDLIADPTEVTRIQYEDFLPNMPNSEYANIEQYNTKPGAVSKRGFSFPAGFLMMVSQLDQHGVSAEFPLKYTHCDIAGSAGGIHNLATASPLRMFATKFIVPRIMPLA